MVAIEPLPQLRLAIDLHPFDVDWNSSAHD